MGVAEIAKMLGISRQRVHAISGHSDTFPRPVADLSAGKIWLRSDVEVWARAQGRPIGRQHPARSHS